MSKVKFDTIKPWIGKKITELLGMEDDVVVEFVYNQLEGENNVSAVYFLSLECSIMMALSSSHLNGLYFHLVPRSEKNAN